MLPYEAFLGLEELKLALSLCSINETLSGVLVFGERGTGKSSLVRSFGRATGVPFLNVPLSATEETLGGLLSNFKGGVVYVDEVNLLPEHLVLVLLSQWDERRFVLIGSMNPEEGDPHPALLERFALCVRTESLKDAKQRVALIKTHLYERRAPLNPSVSLKAFLEERKRRLSGVRASDYVMRLIAETLSVRGIFSNRVELFWLEASKAHAALRGKDEVSAEDVEAVSEMVLRHRTKLPETRKKKEEKQQEKGGERRETEPSKRNSPTSAEAEPEGSKEEEPGAFEAEKPTIPVFKKDKRERKFPVGEVFVPSKRLLGKEEAKRADLSGKSVVYYGLSGRGRFVRGVPWKGEGEISVSATLLNALRRGRRRPRREDLAAKLKLLKGSRLLLFCVDASGSMAAQERMREVKGAIMGFLLSAYQDRDRVALITFRERQATLVLPPTSSVALASKLLKELPVGGSTPLAAALRCLYKTVVTFKKSNPFGRVVALVVTDGRANVGSQEGSPLKEAYEVAKRISQELDWVKFVVIDTEVGPVKLDLAKRLSEHLNALYFTPETIKKDSLLSLALKYFR